MNDMVDPQRVADFLIKEGLLLTALELHVELAEKGKGLASLDRFFQDQKNFEAFTTATKCSPLSSACGSQAGLDDVSLFDLTRNSEDSHMVYSTHDRVAVLEFELRKARETIFTLREELTQQAKTQDEDAETVNLHEDDSDDDGEDHEAAKAHEKRIVNFLVNEYLLQYGYKLTSITFSDENNDADYFEDWDNIGINVTKPPSLLRLYRDFGKHKAQQPTKDADSMTDADPVVLELQQKYTDERELMSKLESRCQELESILDHQTTANQQLGLQLREKEAVIEILKSHKEDNEETDENHASITVSIPDEEATKKSKFVEMMEKLCYPSGVLDEEVCIKDDIINELAESLPKIVPNILLNKREELLPLLLTAIQHHPDDQIRDQLLNLLFNLTKKPDSDQRKVILKGFKKIAKTLGSERVEAELLPQLWEQLDHKYPERRLLVAETCAVLLPYIPTELVGSLVFSMLQQLALEDKDLEVRVSSVTSFSVLTLYLSNDSNKAESVLEILNALLQDPSHEIVAAVHDKLLPSVAKWLLDHKSFDLANFIDSRLQDLLRQAAITEDDKTLMTMLEEKVKSLQITVPYTIAMLVKTLPKSAESGKDDLQSTDVPNDFLLQLILSEESSKFKPKDLKSYLSREWYESWPKLDWFKATWIPQVTKALTSIPGSDASRRVVSLFIDLFSELSECLGSNFTRDIISPQFLQYLPPPPLDIVTTEFSPEELKSYESCLLPIFVQGVLTKIESSNGIADRLQELAISYCTSGIKTWSLEATIELVVNYQADAGHRDAIAEMGWTLVVHNSPNVKVMACTTLKHLAKQQGEEDLVGHKILPGLVTLSSDPEPLVRSSAMAGLAQVIIANKSSAEAREKAAFQLVSFLNIDHERVLEVQVSAIKAVGNILSKDNCPHKLRDDLFLPKLAEYYDAIGIDDLGRMKIYETMLSTVYGPLCSGSYAGGYLDDEPPPRLPLNTVQLYVVPILRRLAVDCQRLKEPNLETTASSLISKLEAIHGTSFRPILVADQQLNQPVNSGISSLTSSTSMDEMKQKMGKLFQKPGGQPFWKK